MKFLGWPTRWVAVIAVAVLLVSGSTPAAFGHEKSRSGLVAESTYETPSVPVPAVPPAVASSPHHLGQPAPNGSTATQRPGSGTQSVSVGGTITGHIRDRSGALTDQVDVFAETFDSSGNSTFRAWSRSGVGGDLGAFSLSGLPAGDYFVEFYDPHY